MSKNKKGNSNSTVRIARSGKTGQFRVKPDSRDFRGGFQPRSTSTSMPSLPKSGSSVHVVRKANSKVKTRK